MRWSVPHISQKIHKSLGAKPPSANLYASATVVSVLAMFLVKAATAHSVVAVPLRGIHVSVLFWIVAVFSFSATTCSYSIFSAQFFSKDFCFPPTITSAEPHGMTSPSWLKLPNYDQHAKTFCEKIEWMGWHK
jgi:hypothetical protein